MADVTGCTGDPSTCDLVNGGPCFRCRFGLALSRWGSSSPAWLKQKLWHDKQGHLRWQFGCSMCSRLYRQTHKAPNKVIPWAQLTHTKAPKLNHLKRHEDCCYHQEAVKGNLLALAPAVDDFLLVFRHVVNHGSAAGVQGLASVGGCKKTIQMVLALAEGVLEADRAHIKDSVSISLMRDVRKGLAAVRFIAVTKNLVVRSGLLGVAGHLHRFGVGAQGLLQTTNHIINNFATANRSTSVENFDNDVRRSLRKHTHMVTVDAASDEVVASEIMRVSASEALSPLTPNVGIVLRDKAHASRRILSRPWKADSYLTEVMDMIASGPDCPAQMIQRSEDIKSQFLLILEAHDPSNKTQNLRAAKHRFESFQKPLGRTIRLFLPIHALMVRLAVRGRETLAKRAKTWLTSISEQPSRLVMAAMLADAADEAMALTRFCDSEGMDVSELPAQISSFLDRVTTLFGPRRYSLECTSYTSTMMHTLQDPIVWAIGTRQQNLRAPTPSELDTCFAHMQAWLILAQQTIHA